MSDLRELYQELILDHGQHPRNFGELADADCVQDGFNPLCGDRLTLYVKTEDGVVTAAKFQGQGCAISMASASLMTEAVKGLSFEQVETLFSQFHDVVTGKKSAEAEDVRLGKLLALTGVRAFPARVKCATLAWHALVSALHHEHAAVSTEGDLTNVYD